MIANLQAPIATIRGALGLGSDYYARMLRGKCVVQHKPNRSGHVPTAQETANRQRFIQQFRKQRTGAGNFATTSRPSYHSVIPAESAPHNNQ